MTDPVSQAKQRLRTQLLQVRKQLPIPVQQQRSQQVCEQLIALPEFKRAKTILFYMSIQGEVNVTTAIEKTWQAGKQVLLPRVDQERQLQIYQVDHWHELQPGAFGILEPSSDRCLLRFAHQVDLILVPGVAFDRKGHRLGFGGGYYDRFLVQVMQALRIGIAYPEQIVPTVYPEEHDQPMHQILTGTEQIHISL